MRMRIAVSALNCGFHLFAEELQRRLTQDFHALSAWSPELPNECDHLEVDRRPTPVAGVKLQSPNRPSSANTPVKS
jgi:hypothetical protein